MTVLMEYLLRRVISSLLVQGYSHRHNTVFLYKIIREVLEKEFTEDSPLSLAAYSKECYEEAWKDEENAPV